MNKFLTLFCLAASATAEADPYLLGYGGYAGYGAYGLGYAGYGGYAGLGYSRLGYAAAAPVVTAAAPVVTAAAPVVAASYSQVSPSASLTTTGLAPAAIPAVGGAYAGAGRYVANSAGVVHVAKRSADADADADADPYLLGYGGYAGYGGYGLGYAGYGGYGLGYAGYGGYAGLGYAAAPVVTAAAPVVTAAAAPVVAAAAPVVAASYSQVSPSASLTTTGLAPAAIPAVGGAYAGAGRYVANSAGIVHVAKRSADADADPYLLGYGGYAGYGGYGLGYAGYAGLGYAGYGGYAGLGYAAAPIAASYSNVSPSASLTTVGAAPAAIPAVGGAYAGAGRYVANSAGVVHVA